MTFTHRALKDISNFVVDCIGTLRFAAKQEQKTRTEDVAVQTREEMSAVQELHMQLQVAESDAKEAIEYLHMKSLRIAGQRSQDVDDTWEQPIQFDVCVVRWSQSQR